MRTKIYANKVYSKPKAKPKPKSKSQKETAILNPSKLLSFISSVKHFQPFILTKSLKDLKAFIDKSNKDRSPTLINKNFSSSSQKSDSIQKALGYSFRLKTLTSHIEPELNKAPLSSLTFTKQNIEPYPPIINLPFQTTEKFFTVDIKIPSLIASSKSQQNHSKYKVSL